MFFLRFSIDGITEDEIYTEQGYCPNCRANRLFNLKNHGIKIRIFGIPVVSVAGYHSLVCNHCGAAKAVKRKEYRKMFSKQLLRIKKGMCSPEYVLSACHPKKLKIFSRIIKVIAMGWVAQPFIYTFCDFLVNQFNPDLTGLFCMAVIGVFILGLLIPFAMAVNGLHIALRKRSLYRRAKKMCKNK